MSPTSHVLTVSLLVLVAGTACSESHDPDPSLDPTDLTGSYTVTLQVDPASPSVTCNPVSVTLTLAITVTWAACGSSGGGYFPGLDTLALAEDPPTSTSDDRLYRFAGFRGTVTSATSSFLGPCTGQGTGGQCVRQFGRATWSR
jgi:hypothetical protein